MPGVAGGRRVETPVSTQAIAATAFELAGLAGTAETGWAPSLAPLMEAGAEDYHPQPVVSRGVHVFEDQEAVVMGRYRYIRRIDSGIEELFDIESDPSEAHSILASFPQVAESARQRLDEINAEALKIRAGLGIDESGEDEWDEDTIRRLKNLGYL
jgi:arylsulfatase A-like enzyme